MTESTDADDGNAIPGLTPHCTIGLNTVIPPQKSGPALLASSSSGNGLTHVQ